jgi:hypothetical protein
MRHRQNQPQSEGEANRHPDQRPHVTIRRCTRQGREGRPRTKRRCGGDALAWRSETLNVGEKVHKKCQVAPVAESDTEPDT